LAKKNKRGGTAWKSGYSAYKAENRVKKNAIKRLEKHLKMYPNDEQGKARLQEIKVERPYTRNNTRKGRVWTPEEKAYAELMGCIEGKVTHQLTFENNHSKKPSSSQIQQQFAKLLARKIDEKLLRSS